MPGFLMIYYCSKLWKISFYFKLLLFLYSFTLFTGQTTGSVEFSSLWQASFSPWCMQLYLPKLIGSLVFSRLGKSLPGDPRLSLPAHNLSFVPWWSPFRFDYILLFYVFPSISLALNGKRSWVHTYVGIVRNECLIFLHSFKYMHTCI